MDLTLRLNIDLAKATNYIPMGYWVQPVAGDPKKPYYRITDMGIPMVKVADGTSLGYSVWVLQVDVSDNIQPSSTNPQWKLVESADFIYMQQAYIERLQAQLITAEKIESLEVTSKTLRTGASGARTEITGDTIKIYNPNSIFPNIVFGIKNDYAVMEYYDNNGVLLYDLGPVGINMINVVEEGWTAVTDMLYLGIDYTTVLTTSTIKSKYKKPYSVSAVTYYKYTSQRIGGIVQDPDNDGKLFLSKSISPGNTIPVGIYCRRVNPYSYTAPVPFQTPARQHYQNESYYTTSAYQIYFQPLFQSHPSNIGRIGNSVFDAYWSIKSGLPPAEL